MAALKSIWGIDVGQAALKAIKLREVDGQLQAEAFDIVEHPTILSQPEADRPALIRNALEQFLTRNDVANSRLIVAVPGQSSFTRFVKLPPVEPKRIPSIINYEAEQQIPFDINEVIWRWQSFPDPDSPEIEVGLFAVKRSDVYNALEPFGEMDLGIDAVQMSPLALYNFAMHDQQAAPEGATLLIDIGADNTNLVVADGPRMWTRILNLGGNSFTEAVAKAFNLSFAKAEKLKCTAASSKYARQVFQAMRPVFEDLAQEIQRSIGYYTSLHREARFKKLVGVGNGFKLPGLQRFLEQRLNVPVVRLDGFNAVVPGPAVNAAQFQESVLSLGVAYGLALQGLQLARVDTNLLPDEIASVRRWTRKRPWFIAAACMVIAASGIWAVREMQASSVLATSNYDEAQRVHTTYTGLRSQHSAAESQGRDEEQRAARLLQLQGYRTFWPSMIRLVDTVLRQGLPQQAFMDGQEENLAVLRATPPAQRQYVVITSIETTYMEDVTADTGQSTGMDGFGGMGGMGGPMGGMSRPRPGTGGPAAPGGAGGRGYRVTIRGVSPMSSEMGAPVLNRLVGAVPAIASSGLFQNDLEVVRAQLRHYEVPREVDDNLRQPTGRTGMDGFGGMGGMGGPMGDPGMMGPMGPGMGGMGGTGGMAGQTQVQREDPLGHPWSRYAQFEMEWVVRIKGDGLAPATTTD